MRYDSDGDLMKLFLHCNDCDGDLVLGAFIVGSRRQGRLLGQMGTHRGEAELMRRDCVDNDRR